MMTTKKLLAALCASAMILTAFTACGDSESSTADTGSQAEESSAAADDSSEAETTPADDESSTEETAAPAAPATTEVEFEEAVAAEPGDAYLAMTDAQVWLQYWGTTDDILTYDAGVTHIEGNGSYTVSVSCDTNGCRFDATGDANGDLASSGIGFMGVIIKDGETLVPDAIITIDSILIDGNEIELIAKNYTSTEDGCIRSNINNPYISSPSGDARSTEGALYVDGDTSNPALANVDAYSPHIIDTEKIGAWKTIEVNFTVSGLE